MELLSSVLAGYTPQRAYSCVPSLPTLNVMVLVHVRVIYLKKQAINRCHFDDYVISKIISFQLNHYLELHQLRTC